jgi:colicin import membrane protein
VNSKVETHPSLQKRRQPGRIRAFLLAVFVHGAFFALIVFGLTWQVSPTAPLMAELWDKLPPVKTAAPPEPPKPEPPPPEEKKVEPPKPEPPKPDVKPEEAKPDPAIAEKLEREKRRKEKLEREREEKKKAEETKKKQEEARKKREQEEAAKKKAEEERVRREADKARAEAAARRQTEVDRYVEQIKAKIRGKANVPDTVTGNPEVHVRVRILPGGEVLDASITKSSGNRAYDAAIERAIRSAQPLPVPPPDSELFPQFRDLILNIRHER